MTARADRLRSRAPPCYQQIRQSRSDPCLMPVQPRICILSLSPILDDPRVRRQADAFHAAGWDVTVVGLPGGHSGPPPWRLLTSEAAGAGAGTASPSRASHLLRRAFDAANKLTLRLRSDSAAVRMWLAQPRIRALHARAGEVAADIYLANDWPTLPVALALAARHGNALVGYDTHEYALEEYGQRRRWRLMTRPLVHAIEAYGLPRVAVRSAVSAGIAEDMARAYGLAAPPAVIRNVPERQALPPARAGGGDITVLYHGIIAADRGLEEAIGALALLPGHFRLVLRGPGDAQFLDRLAGIAERSGVAERVVFAPAVAMTELVREAATADIGLFAPPARSKQNRYALPNKLFEYVHAGLALCVGDLPDMARLVREHELGRLVADCTAEAIAATLQGFDRATVEHYKANSRRAAEVLNWQSEQKKLLALYEEALVARRSAP
jgi:glycosyltransferase involved in cell wall biosynthesis